MSLQGLPGLEADNLAFAHAPTTVNATLNIVDVSKMNIKQHLKQELTKRGLPTDGLKPAPALADL